MKRAGVDVGNPFMFDPFTLFGLKKQYDLDMELLEEAYFAAQKKTHPDQFSKSSSEEKAEASKRSADINRAYLILKDPLKRAEFLLRETNKDLFSHDPLFLEEVMQWKEQAAAKEDIRDDLLSTQKTLFNTLETSFKQKEYEEAERALYQLTYVHKFLKEIW